MSDKDFTERFEIMNQLYALIFPILAKYETRGFNAHQRAQTITHEVADKMETWILNNKFESDCS